MALTALAAAGTPARHTLLLLTGVLGAALFGGDSVITPAISVLGARGVQGWLIGGRASLRRCPATPQAWRTSSGCRTTALLSWERGGQAPDGGASIRRPVVG
jgi:hypothetical protein